MNPLKKALATDHYTLTEGQAQRLQNPAYDGYDVRVLPPRSGNVPATTGHVVRNIREMGADWLKLRNKSPLIAVELRRPVPETLILQYSVPTKSLERKLRSQFATAIPDIGFEEGDTGLPVDAETTVGGSLLTTARDDWYPLRTDFNYPPTNAIIAALHHHAMQDTRFVIQLLLRPIAGKRIQRRYWRFRARQQENYLRKEKEKVWGSRKPTKREKRQADSIEAKTAGPQWYVSIRVLAIGAGEHTASRVNEVTGGFNAYQHDESGQYLTGKPVMSLREANLFRFTNAVADREYRGWSRTFKATDEEIGALCAIPNRQQGNLQRAGP